MDFRVLEKSGSLSHAKVWDSNTVSNPVKAVFFDTGFLYFFLLVYQYIEC